MKNNKENLDEIIEIQRKNLKFVDGEEKVNPNAKFVLADDASGVISSPAKEYKKPVVASSSSSGGYRRDDYVDIRKLKLEKKKASVESASANVSENGQSTGMGAGSVSPGAFSGRRFPDPIFDSPARPGVPVYSERRQTAQSIFASPSLAGVNRSVGTPTPASLAPAPSLGTASKPKVKTKAPKPKEQGSEIFEPSSIKLDQDLVAERVVIPSYFDDFQI